MTAAPPPRSAAPSDADLLIGVAGRDTVAFVTLFERYAGRIKAFMMRSGASAADADEIAQDVMVAIWRRSASFDPARAAGSTWIYAIARNRRIDMIRRTRRPAPDPADPLFQPDPEPDGLDGVARGEQEARLRDGIASLAPE
ncbi:MAG: sigma-70 family RNA polymerase sigma factor, partial [Rhodobacteraceae bacterium]|nr:sigma-70 family RNA polymerase sigma factor [Paracoccaceae bacterium]